MKVFFAALRISLRAIARAKARAALTVLGILIGVAAVVVVVALGNAVRDQVLEQIATLGANTIYVFPEDTRASGARVAARPRLTEADGEALVREATSIAKVTPLSTARGQLVVGERNHPTTIMGIGDDYFDVMAYSVKRGESFSAVDFRLKSKVVILGDSVRKELFGSQDGIGEYVRIGKHPFRVVGVLAPKGQSPFGEDQDDRVLVPIGTFRARIQRSAPGRVQLLVASASDERTVERAVTQIEQILRQRHRIDPDDRPDFGVRTQAEIRKSNEQTFTILTALLSSIAAISLLVGGIGVMNVMLVSVTERTREIGIRLAIGAREGDILLQFLVEAVVLSTIGGLLGLVAAIAGIAVLRQIVDWSFQIPFDAVVLAFGTSAGVGIIFGILAARRAARLDPIEALRHE